ncbi:MAG: flagellar motor protein MotB [Pseudomonadales bacterium]
MDDECQCPEPEPGIPAWLPTFADLMSLLMCFFVLLLSFSNMDLLEFKRLAGSMRDSFGVQNKLKVEDIPKGTSIIAQEFSPGRPEPTPINEVWQKTDEMEQSSLALQCAAGAENRTDGAVSDAAVQAEIVKKVEQLVKATEQDAMDLAAALQDQIAAGEVDVETHARQIIIRIKEKGAFSSGSASLTRSYYKVLKKLGNVLAAKSGAIAVQGHTDNIPIRTDRFRSNWDLSSARAVSVAHELLRSKKVPPARLTVSGFGSTRPLVDNKSAATRASNRRVEIVIQQGFDASTAREVNALKSQDPGLYDSLELDSKVAPKG